MKSSILILTFLFSFLVFKVGSQSFPCESFCVTNIAFSSAASEVMNVTIFFEGEDDDFINYPYVSLVTDILGDTIAMGTLNFFGQFGNTSQDYPVNSTLSSVPDSLIANVYFHFDTSVCVLRYPCSTTAIEEISAQILFEVYPNPVTTHAVISLTEEFEYDLMAIYNLHGQEVYGISIDGRGVIPFERGGLSGGVYLMVLKGGKGYAVKKIIIAD